MSQKVEKKKTACAVLSEQLKHHKPRAFVGAIWRLERDDLITGVFFSFRSKRCNKRACRSRKGERPYYVRMAVAWLLASALAKIPEMTRSYVNSCRLPEDVIRLYKRKARESFKTRDVNPL